jgi:predicted tellurium resistance membrane protein TerC
MDWSWLSSPEAWIGLFWLTLMEVVLGIDNVVFLSILVSRLPADQQPWVRRTGLLLAMGMRLGLLFTLSWMMGLTAPLLSVAGHTFSGRDLVLVIGGGFLIAKATQEVYGTIEGSGHGTGVRMAPPRVGAVLTQVAIMDLVFSLDSVITAVGMVRHIPVMVTAVIISVLVMLWLAEPIAALLQRHPSLRVLALSFLLLIGVLLLADGFGQHLPRGYVYSSMAFALLVELLNMRMRARATPHQEQGIDDDRLAG